MSDDIGRVLGAWDYEPGELRVRTIDGEKGDGQKGHVEIDYFNEDDLTRIMDLLLGSA